jgi:HAD superfamily hydrolase (TIGR01459 family)
MRHLSGLSDIADQYDGFIIDLWGVIHDGITPYPGALACLERLRGRPVLLLSNAPRRAQAAQQSLRSLGIPDALYTDILTSGEATWLALRDRHDPWFARLGQRVYHLGPERDRSVIDGLELQLTAAPGQADFVLNTGPDDHRNGESLDDFIVELDACREAGLPMICANPDLEIVRGGVRILCAGALAAYYAERGGDVRAIGKPDAQIYDQALAMLDLPRSRVLAVGDSLRTDIAGAAASGIDAVWVLGGIHADALGGNPDTAECVAARAGLAPLAAMRAFAWDD